MLEKYSTSLRFWILIAVSVYFAYSTYYAVAGMRDSIGMLSNQYIYSSLSKNSWWWMVLFYGSEGASGSVAILSRVFAGAFAVCSAYLFWRKKDTAMPTIKKTAGWALVFEAIFFLALIPSIITAFAYNSTSENLFYFGHTPGALLLFGTAIPCLAVVLVVPPLLLKLRSAIVKGKQTLEIAKWIGAAAVGYLFTVFWFTYTMLWAGGILVPYERVYEQYGLSFLLEPANLLSFGLTFGGLLALSIAGFILARPVIKKQSTALNLRWIGVVLVAFGGYFVFNAFYYYLTGGYSAHPSVWYEVISPMHNPNLWAIALILVGMPLMIQGRVDKEKTPQFFV